MLNVFPVTGQQRFSQADLEEKRRQLLLQDAALRAARRAQSDRKKTPKSTQAARRGTDRKQDTAAQKQRGQAKKQSLTGKRRRTGTAVRRDPSPGSVSDAQPVSDSGQSDTTATWSDLDFDEEEDGFPASDLADVQARLATTGAHGGVRSAVDELEAADPGASSSGAASRGDHSPYPPSSEIKMKSSEALARYVGSIWTAACKAKM